MGHGFGSFIAVLIAAALCVAIYKVIKARLADRNAPSGGIGGDPSDGDGTVHPNEQ